MQKPPQGVLPLMLMMPLFAFLGGGVQQDAPLLTMAFFITDGFIAAACLIVLLFRRSPNQSPGKTLAATGILVGCVGLSWFLAHWLTGV
ncbi:hypothetical protein EXS71_02685 [Candidatus Uhrbacteria bacterium]|nr:hypothetical protein [Candidatus Uhrbacteria bacterium]